MFACFHCHKGEKSLDELEEVVAKIESTKGLQNTGPLHCRGCFNTVGAPAISGVKTAAAARGPHCAMRWPTEAPKAAAVAHPLRAVACRCAGACRWLLAGAALCCLQSLLLMLGPGPLAARSDFGR